MKVNLVVGGKCEFGGLVLMGVKSCAYAGSLVRNKSSVEGLRWRQWVCRGGREWWPGDAAGDESRKERYDG